MRSGVHSRKLFVFMSLAFPHFLFCLQSLQISLNLHLIFLVTSYSPISQCQFLKIFKFLFFFYFFFFLNKTRSSPRSEIFFIRSLKLFALLLVYNISKITNVEIQKSFIHSNTRKKYFLGFVRTNWLCPVNQ